VGPKYGKGGRPKFWALIFPPRLGAFSIPPIDARVLQSFGIYLFNIVRDIATVVSGK
jgi:hypothetical protein